MSLRLKALGGEATMIGGEWVSDDPMLETIINILDPHISLPQVSPCPVIDRAKIRAKKLSAALYRDGELIS